MMILLTAFFEKNFTVPANCQQNFHRGRSHCKSTENSDHDEEQYTFREMDRVSSRL